MKKVFIVVIVLTMIMSFSGCSTEVESLHNKPIIAVSVVPQETFVKAVAGDLVDIVTMIPPGNSPANYQPTPQQMQKLSQASVYFAIGVPAEVANILPRIMDISENIEVVSLDEQVAEVYSDRYFDEDEEEHGHDEEHDEDVEHHENEEEAEHENHNHDGRDPHIWLSPKRVKVMIEEIKEQLIELNPENKEIYEKNAEDYIKRLDEVDNDIRETLKGLDKQSFIVYHPSFGYFADDFGLDMIAIEESGKEATAKRLQHVIDLAKEEGIKFVFYQAEFDSQQAETIAEEIDGEAIMVEPLSPDYINNLRVISNSFKKVLE